MKENKDKKTSKGKLMLFGGIGLLLMVFVAAAIIQHSVSREVVVTEAFTFVGDSSENIEAFAGQTSLSKKMTLDSKTTVNIPLSIVTTPTDNSEITHTEEYILSTIGIDGHDSGIYIDVADTNVVTLDDLINISWDVNVLTGYIVHVDVLIDTTGNGLVDDALVFEYAKVAAPYDNSESYPIGEVNTFGDKGIISDSSYAWLTTEDAGPVSGEGYTAYTLGDWKLGKTSNKNSKVIPADVVVIGFDVEIDNWIEDSTSDVSNVLINGNEVELTLKPSETLDFRVSTEFDVGIVAGTYNVSTIVTTR